MINWVASGPGPFLVTVIGLTFVLSVPYLWWAFHADAKAREADDTPAMSQSGWHEVWECPRCGTQLAVGGTVTLDGPPTCSSYGHEPVECEQKLVQAFPLEGRR